MRLTERDPDRETPLHRELGALPLPRAPRTLLPRVMAAIARPFYTRPWLTWPALWQTASAIALVAVATATWMLLPQVEPLAELSRTASRASTFVDLVSRALLQPLAVWILTLSAAASLACGALWAALMRLVPGDISS